MKPYTEADVDAAFNELRPLAQKLVDRFGQVQTHAILSAVRDDTCPDGGADPPIPIECFRITATN